MSVTQLTVILNHDSMATVQSIISSHGSMLTTQITDTLVVLNIQGPPPFLVKTDCLLNFKSPPRNNYHHYSFFFLLIWKKKKKSVPNSFLRKKKKSYPYTWNSSIGLHVENHCSIYIYNVTSSSLHTGWMDRVNESRQKMNCR